VNATASTSFTELAQRANDGIEVTLLWRRRDGLVRVSVADATTGASFRFDVDPGRALDAFEHPYVYAATAQVAHDLEPSAPPAPAAA
jgi:hypothetical protein